MYNLQSYPAKQLLEGYSVDYSETKDRFRDPIVASQATRAAPRWCRVPRGPSFLTSRGQLSLQQTINHPQSLRSGSFKVPRLYREKRREVEAGSLVDELHDHQARPRRDIPVSRLSANLKATRHSMINRKTRQICHIRKSSVKVE